MPLFPKPRLTDDISEKVEDDHSSVVEGVFNPTKDDIIDDSGALAKHIDLGEWECPFCNRIEDTKAELQHHILLEHPSRFTPDELFSALESFYNLPISYTRNDYEHNPDNREDIKKLPIDILEFIQRFKRSKRDMDLFFKIGLKYTKGCFTKGEN